jgi:hypothetical protein
MDQIYKGHNIQASAWLGIDGWQPGVVVTYSEGGKNVLKNVTMDHKISPHFSTLRNHSTNFS